jgi:hypothetical protein
MAKKINIVGKGAERIELKGRGQRRIEPAEFAAALGAKPCEEMASSPLDLINLAELGNQLIKLLRAPGGLPAFKEAPERCHVPLSPDDIAALETIVGAIEEVTGARPNLGHVANVILRMHVEELRDAARAPLPEQPLVADH